MSTVDHYNIDRKAASKLLKVSIRTLDRYIKSKKMSTRVVDGRVWLNEAEIKRFKGVRAVSPLAGAVDVSTSDMSIDKEPVYIDKEQDNDDKVTFVDDHSEDRKSEGGIYKKLYEELNQQLNEKQARLEIANYRVGQLEAQVKSSVPMLEYHKQNYEKEIVIKKIENELTEKQSLLNEINSKLRLTTFNKRIILAILLLVLALQPLWLILYYQ